MVGSPSLCFVIGPIGDAASPTRRKADWVLNGLIKPVLELPEFGYHVKRADQDPNPGSISDAMINDIFDADLVIADLTGFNPNAFYELGIRHAFQKPAIHIIAERGTKPPFDNQDQRTIEVDFDDFYHVQAAKTALHSAVAFVRADGFIVSNPVTRARGFAELKATGDPKDLLVANLQGELEAMEARLRNIESTAGFTKIIEQGSLETTNTRFRNRFGEYHSYIRDAIRLGLQVPFPFEAAQYAISASKNDFINWYRGFKDKDWADNLSGLDKESFDFLRNRMSLIKELSPMQLKKIRFEDIQRAAS